MIADGLHVGRGTLRALRHSLLTHVPDRAIGILQDVGYASGDGIYEEFARWLRESHGLSGPDELDAAHLNDVLATFFTDMRWGTLSISPLGSGALAVDSPDWVEADPGSAEIPMCFFTAGLLADFLGRLSGEAVSVMEVECRSRSDDRCRFLSGSPETLQRVYAEMTAGRSYEEALRAP